MEKNKKLNEEITYLKRDHASQSLRMTKIVEANRIADERKRDMEEVWLKAEKAKRLAEEDLRENNAIIIKKD